MKKRQLTPLALAVGLALISQVGLAKDQTGATIKATQATTTKAFTDTTDTYTARDADTETVAGVNGRTLNVTFKDLTLVNNSTNQLSSVINADTGTLTFTGGKLTLNKEVAPTQAGYGNQSFISNKKPTTSAPVGTLTFDTAVSMGGSVPYGIYLQGTATFKQGYDMEIDRTGQTGSLDVAGVLFQSGGSLTTDQPTSMTVTASANDKKLQGIVLTTGEKLSTKTLMMTLNGNKSLTNFQGIVDVTNQTGKADMTVDGPLSITMKTGQEARALDLRGKRNYVFADAAEINLSDVTTAFGLYTSSQVEFQGNVDMTLDATGDSWGIYAYRNETAQATDPSANVTLKKAVIKFTGDDKTVDQTAIYLQDKAQLEAESLETNAKQALLAEGGSSIRVTGDLIAFERESAIDADGDGSNIVVNADGTGKVQFWGSTGIVGNSTLEMNVGSGTAAEDSY